MFEWLKKVTAPVVSKEPLKANCPYCSIELNKFPTRKQKCKSCGKEFIVRTHYLTKQKLVLTEKDAAKYDVEKENYYTDKSLIDGLKNYIGVDAKQVDKLVNATRDELTKKFGFTAALGDVAWSISNMMIAEAIKKGDKDMIKAIHFQQAMYLHNTGRDCKKIQQLIFDDDLREIKKSEFIKKVSISTAKESACEHCKKLEGKIMTIDEALKTKPLPCGECSYKMSKRAKTGWCRCMYLSEID